ncbi:MAG TPA: NAD(P)/FAD-dependent oxidoreductase [Candidatus Limiplasma sp.]|nr:NAD(P)/FAD-dependent oxidoreductase [Candidatus Limiplasma sp.]HPS81293.1 NAD(P)/FAD-dependent oxidoreductase [Candidatus Limiplasma sp.]
MPSIVILGGGAAGLIAAVTAAENGATVTLVERNEKLGKKLYITGKGRCNCTNLCAPEAFRQNVVRNPRFLFSALEALPPEALLRKLEAWGCPTVVERGNRAFPASQKASDVTRALERQLQKNGVRVRLNSRAKAIAVSQGRVSGVTLETGETLPADAAIVCTGGVSYPATGSTGDGYALLAACGHAILPPKPALIPLTSPEEWVRGLQGLSLKNVRLTLMHGKKRLYAELGEMLFTHFGLSGPLVLSASSYMAGLDFAQCSLTLDLKPGLTPQQLEERILRDIGAAGKKHLQTVLRGLYPERLAETVAALCGLDPIKPANELKREEREALVRLTKALPLPVNGTEPIAAAVVTAGGADVREFSPATLQSKRVEGLYAAGEVLDVDALTGGFNLHIAFATGYCAGLAAALQGAAER